MSRAVVIAATGPTRISRWRRGGWACRARLQQFTGQADRNAQTASQQMEWE